MTEHRASERSLYDRLQAPEHAEARDLLESLIADSSLIYETIVNQLNSSGLFESIKQITAQDLTRYRQRKATVENRADVMSLIESEQETLLAAAGKNPQGAIAKYLRQTLAEQAVRRFEDEAAQIGVVDLSRETARHALVEQRDQRLDIDREKIELEKQRIELAKTQAAFQNDRFQIAAETWRFTLGWFVNEEPDIAGRLVNRSEEFLIQLEESIAAN